VTPPLTLYVMGNAISERGPAFGATPMEQPLRLSTRLL
jgi:hypothetical protein